MLDLTCPNFSIFIGSSDISLHVTGYSFKHPLAEPSTPLVWTGQIELDLTIDTTLGASFFDDEVNPSIWLSGLQPIDVYFEGTWWQRFRIKPNGYRYDQITGQAVVEVTDIIGILDGYQPSADAPEFKTGGNNYWNDLAVKLINKQAALMGITVSCQTPPYGIGGIYKVPRTISGSYIKEAQKMAGERGIWMWSDKEVIKWATYPQTAQNIVWQKSRKQLLNYTRQQGLDSVKTKITVSATHEDVDDCNNVYPQVVYSYASGNVATDTTGVATAQAYRVLSAITVRDRIITNDCIYNFTTKTIGNPALILFGGQVDNGGRISVNIPDAKGYTITKLGGYDWWLEYTKSDASFNFNWQQFSGLLDQTDITTYENVPLDSQNPSKILKRVVTKSEPWAKFPDGLQYFGLSEWLTVNVNNSRRITERKTTTYTYREIFRDDIVVQTGQRLYEIASVEEVTEQVYFYRFKVNPTLTTTTPLLVPSSRTLSVYTRICQGRWKERKIVQQNKGQSSTSYGYLFGVTDTEDFVTSIPDITYRPPAYPVKQKPLLGSAITGYTGVSPYVNSNEFANASTLTTKGECDAYAVYLGRLKWQRYYGRELASGFGTVLNYAPFQGAYAGNGAYIRDRFGVSLNRDGEAWQFVEDCVGNKVASIPEIAPPNYPYPALLTTTLNIGNIPDQTYTQGLPISSITFISAGGQTPYTYSSTTLPAGLSLSSGGVLTGTPTAIATTSVTVTVTDALAATATTTFNIIVIAAPIPISIISETIVYEIDVDDVSTVSFLGGIPIPIETNSKADDISSVTFPIPISIAADDASNITFITPFVLTVSENDYSSSHFLVESITADDISSIEFTGAPANPLLDYTLAYFNFDDTSSNLTSYDSTGLYRFYFPSFNATYSTGLINNAVACTALGGNMTTLAGTFAGLETAKYDLTVASFLGFAVWVKFNSNPASFINTRYFGSASSSFQFRLLFDPASPKLTVTDSSATNYDIFVDTSTLGSGQINLGDWYLFNIELNPSTGDYSFRISDSATVTGTGLTSYNAPYTGSDDVDMGIQGTYTDIDFDEMYFYNTPLNPSEYALLYNGGAGVAYPF